MAHQGTSKSRPRRKMHIMSDSCESSEADSFRSPSMSFVVVAEDNQDLTVNEEDMQEDAELAIIRDLTLRVSEMSDALSQNQSVAQATEEEKGQLQRRIRQLEEQMASSEQNFLQRIQTLEEQVEEAQNKTVTNSAAGSTWTDDVNVMKAPTMDYHVEQLTIENTNLKQKLEESSSSRMVALVKTKNKDIQAKEQRITQLLMEKDELEALLLEEQENASNEKMQLMQRIEELSKSKKATPSKTATGDLRAKEEELRRKEERIAELQNEKEELESLLLEEQENSGKEKEQLQTRIEELLSGKKGSPSSSLQAAGELRAKEEELRRKEQRIAELQNEKDELEGLLMEEQENSSKEREQLESKIAELKGDAPSDNTALIREKEALERKCATLEQQMAEMKNLYDEQMKELREQNEQNCGSLQLQIAEMTRQREAEVEALRKKHDNAMKEQQAKAKTEVNQLKRELESLKRNRQPDGGNSEELGELRAANQRLEDKLREYEINNNKLTKKKGDLLAEMRGLRQDKARLDAELVISNRRLGEMVPSEEVDRLRGNLTESQTEVMNHTSTIHELQMELQQLRSVQAATAENRGRSNNKDSDKLQYIYNSLARMYSGRRKEEQPDKKNSKSLMEAIIRLSDAAHRSWQEQNELVELMKKEKEFEIRKRHHAEHKLVEVKNSAADQLQLACERAKEELAAQFAEHAQHERQFIEFLQTRLELVTSPFFQERMQPVPAYNGCSHFVGQPLPQP